MSWVNTSSPKWSSIRSANFWIFSHHPAAEKNDRSEE
jgi:hypothetical protein